MIVYEPFAVDETNLTSTNLTESTSEWDAGTTYSAGDEVHVTSTKTVYVSAIDSNTGNDPATSDADTWIIRGAMNTWAAFDYFVANKATRAGNISYTITVDQIVTGISFFGLKADSLTVTVLLGAGSKTYNADLDTVDHINGSWFNWFYGGRPKRQEFTINNLAYYGVGTEIQIDIAVDSGDAEVGQIVLGKQNDVGYVIGDGILRSQSFTRYSEDEFGNIVTIPRTSARLPELTTFVDNGNVRRTERLLRGIEGSPTVFVGLTKPERGLIIFGILRDFEIDVMPNSMHQVRLKIRGLL